ncbi:MAG: glutamate formimidoyltransferase [Clostridia bacterium]|nr:glutamate formimidoyltransferase [Clostridia bacterium]
MTGKIVECVPNISEGRNAEIVAECVSAVASVENVKVLNFTSDYDHNRSVITFIGTPEGVSEAAVRLSKKAAELIDLTKHSGEHPRMGAVDVCPFIPVKNVSADEVVELAKATGKRIYEEAGVPVYLYEKAASASHRENLADVRRGQFEGLEEKTSLPEWQPDFGSGYHPTAGITIVGAREFLIAFNIELDTDDVEIAKKIAKTIRFSSGGYPCVKALGLMLHETDTAQVSINFTDYKTTSLYTVVDKVREEAKKYGTDVKCTELIGLSPMKALIDSAAHYLKIKDFDYDNQVFENHLL